MAAYFNKLNILKMREYFNINHLNREKFIMREIQVKKNPAREQDFFMIPSDLPGSIRDFEMIEYVRH